MFTFDAFPRPLPAAVITYSHACLTGSLAAREASYEVRSSLDFTEGHSAFQRAQLQYRHTGAARERTHSSLWALEILIDGGGCHRKTIFMCCNFLYLKSLSFFILLKRICLLILRPLRWNVGCPRPHPRPFSCKVPFFFRSDLLDTLPTSSFLVQVALWQATCPSTSLILKQPLPCNFTKVGH